MSPPGEAGKPIVWVARITTTEIGMGGTLAFQHVLAPSTASPSSTASRRHP
ncbi:MAG: hypothetical protein ACYC9X_04070 [Dehalococcoidia bacterium]